MSPLDNPEYQAEATAIVVSVGKVVDTIKTNGMGTVSIMLILGELMALAEVWDAAIGNEPTALVGQVGFFEGDSLEAMSDGLKAGALAYFNKTVPQIAA